jgi:hypothetical protein
MFSLHTLASSSGRNVNYDEKQLSGGKKISCSFHLYRFGKYASYGFPIINVCIPGVHYETSCIIYIYIYIYIASRVIVGPIQRKLIITRFFVSEEN